MDSSETRVLAPNSCEDDDTVVPNSREETLLRSLQQTVGGSSRTQLAFEFAAWPLAVWATCVARTARARSACSGLAIRGAGDKARIGARYMDAKWWRFKLESCSNKTLAVLAKHRVCEIAEARSALTRSLGKTALTPLGNSWKLSDDGVALQALLNEGRLVEDAARRTSIASHPEVRAHNLLLKWESSPLDTNARAESISSLVKAHGSPQTCIERLFAAGPPPLLAAVIVVALNSGPRDSRFEWLAAIMDSGLLSRSQLKQAIDAVEKRGPLDDDVELDILCDGEDNTERVNHRIRFWKLTCAARHAVGRLVGTSAVCRPASPLPRWWDPLETGTRSEAADRFARWWWLIRSSRMLAPHHGCLQAKGRRGNELDTFASHGYIEPFSSLMIENIADFGAGGASRHMMLQNAVVSSRGGDESVYAAAAGNQTQLGDGGLGLVLARNETRVVLCSALGGLHAVLFGPSSSVPNDDSEMWWRPPERALPLFFQAWSRAKPWHRFVLAFGELPAAAWNAAFNFDVDNRGVKCKVADDLVDQIYKQPERVCTLGVGPGQVLLLALVSDNPTEAATALAHTIRAGLESKDLSAACSVAALVVCVLEGPAHYQKGRLRVPYPTALSMLLSAGDRDSRDDAALANVANWTPTQAAAWCACALASTSVGGAASAARAVEGHLRHLLDKGGANCATLFQSAFCNSDTGQNCGPSRSRILEATGISRSAQTALSTEVERLASMRENMVPGLARAREIVGCVLACGQDDGARPALLAITSAALKLASGASVKSKNVWLGAALTNSKSERFASAANALGGLRLKDSTATAWRTTGELFVAASVLLKYCHAGAVASALPMLCWALEMYCESIFAIRDRVKSVQRTATAAARSAGNEESLKEIEEGEIRNAALTAEADLLGICARNSPGFKSSLSVLCPQGCVLASVIPTFSAFILGSRLLCRISGSVVALGDADDAAFIAEAAPGPDIIGKTRQAALAVVTESLIGAESACRAWLTELGGFSECLIRGRSCGASAAAMTRQGFPPTVLASLQTTVFTINARASLGLSACLWRARPDSGFVSMAPVDEAAPSCATAFVDQRSPSVSDEQFDMQTSRAKASSHAFVLRRPLHELHMAALRDVETKMAIKGSLPCIAAIRLTLPRLTSAHGRRPWQLQEGESWSGECDNEVAEVANCDAETLGNTIRDLMKTVATKLVDIPFDTRSESVLRELLDVETAILGLCCAPDAVRPSALFSATPRSTTGGNGDDNDAQHFRAKFVSNVFPTLASVFHARFSLVENIHQLERAPFASEDGVFAKMDSVAVRRCAERQQVGALEELRWRYCWTSWLVGPSETVRKLARDALFSSGDETHSQHIREWLGHLLLDVCRTTEERDPTAASTRHDCGVQVRRDMGPNLADAAAATAARRLLHAGALSTTHTGTNPPLLLACRSGSVLLALALIEGGALVESPSLGILVNAARRARAFELVEFLTRLTSKKVDNAVSPDAIELWPGISSDKLFEDEGDTPTDAADYSGEDCGVGKDDEEEDDDANAGMSPWEWMPDTRAAIIALVSAKCNVRAANESILHHCMRFRLLDAAKYLLEHGADPNKPDAAGVYPLHLACGMDVFVKPACGFSSESVRLDQSNDAEFVVRRAQWQQPHTQPALIPRGAAARSFRVKAKSMSVPFQGSTVVLRFSPPSAAAVELLLLHGALCDIKAPDSLGTPLAVALRAVASVKADMLRCADDWYSANMADTAARSWTAGLSPHQSHDLLDVVRMARHPGIVAIAAINNFIDSMCPTARDGPSATRVFEKIIEASKESPDPRARAALAEASALKCARLLLGAGADPLAVFESHKDPDWPTPLHCAAGSGQIQAVDLLLRNAGTLDICSLAPSSSTPLVASIGGGPMTSNTTLCVSPAPSVRISGRYASVQCAARILKHQTRRRDDCFRLICSSLNSAQASPLLVAARNGALDTVAMMLSMLRDSDNRATLISGMKEDLEDILAAALAYACHYNDAFQARSAVEMILDLHEHFNQCQTEELSCRVSLVLQRHASRGGPCYARRCLAPPESPTILQLLLAMAPRGLCLEATADQKTSDSQLSEIGVLELLCESCKMGAPGCAAILLRRLQLLPSCEPPSLSSVNNFVGYIDESGYSLCDAMLLGAAPLTPSEDNEFQHQMARLMDWLAQPLNLFSFSPSSDVSRRADIFSWCAAIERDVLPSPVVIIPDFSILRCAVHAALVSHFGKTETRNIITKGLATSPRELEAATVGAKTYGSSDEVGARAIAKILSSKSRGSCVTWRPSVLSTLNLGSLRQRSWRWAPISPKAMKRSRIVDKFSEALFVFGNKIPLRRVVSARFFSPGTGDSPSLFSLLVRYTAGAAATRRLSALLKHVKGCTPSCVAEVLGLETAPTQNSEHPIWGWAPSRQTALHAACAGGMAESAAVIARLAHSAGLESALANVEDSLGRKALFEAVRHGDDDDAGAAQCVAVLLSLGVDPESREERVWIADNSLVDETTRNDKIIPEFVPMHGQLAAWVSAFGTRLTGPPALYEAVRRGALKTARELLIAGARGYLPFEVTQEDMNPNDSITLNEWCVQNRVRKSTWQRAKRALRVDTPREVSSWCPGCESVLAISGKHAADRHLVDPRLRRIFGTRAHTFVPALSASELNVRVVDLDERRQSGSAIRYANKKLEAAARRVFMQLARCAHTDTKSTLALTIREAIEWFSSNAPAARELLADAPHSMSRVVGSCNETEDEPIPAMAQEAVQRAFVKLMGDDSDFDDGRVLGVDEFILIVHRLCCDHVPIASGRNEPGKEQIVLKLETDTDLRRSDAGTQIVSGALQSSFEDGRAWLHSDNFVQIRAGFEGRVRFAVHTLIDGVPSSSDVARSNWFNVSSNPSPARRVDILAPRRATAGELIKGIRVAVFDVRGHKTRGSEQKVVVHICNKGGEGSQTEGLWTDPISIQDGETPIDISFMQAGECIARAHLIDTRHSSLSIATSRSLSHAAVASSKPACILIEPAAPSRLIVCLDAADKAAVEAGTCPPIPEIRIQDCHGNDGVVDTNDEIVVRLLRVGKSQKNGNDCTISPPYQADAQHTLKLHAENGKGRMTQKQISALRVCGIGAYVWEAVAKLTPAKDGRAGVKLHGRSSEFVVVAGDVSTCRIVAPNTLEAGTPLDFEVLPCDENGNYVSFHQKRRVVMDITNSRFFSVPMVDRQQNLRCQGLEADGSFCLQVTDHDSVACKILAPGSVVWNDVRDDVEQCIDVRVEAEMLTNVGEYRLRVSYDKCDVKVDHYVRVVSADPAFLHVAVTTLGAPEICASSSRLDDDSDARPHAVSEGLVTRTYLADEFGNLCRLSTATISLEIYSLSQDVDPQASSDVEAHRVTFTTAAPRSKSKQSDAVCADMMDGVADFSHQDLKLPGPGLYALVAHGCIWPDKGGSSSRVKTLTGVSRPVRGCGGPPSSLRFVPLKSDDLVWPAGRVFTAGVPLSVGPCIEVLDESGYPAQLRRPAFMVLSLSRACDADLEERMACDASNCRESWLVLNEDEAIATCTVVANAVTARARNIARSPRLMGNACALLPPESSLVCFDAATAELIVALPGTYLLVARLFGFRTPSSPFTQELACCESSPFTVLAPTTWDHETRTPASVGLSNEMAQWASCRSRTAVEAALRAQHTNPADWEKLVSLEDRLRKVYQQNTAIVQRIRGARRRKLRADDAYAAEVAYLQTLIAQNTSMSSSCGEVVPHQVLAHLESEQQLTLLARHEYVLRHKIEDMRTELHGNFVEANPTERSTQASSRPLAATTQDRGRNSPVVATSGTKKGEPSLRFVESLNQCTESLAAVNVAAVDALMAEADRVNVDLQSARDDVWEIFASRASFPVKTREGEPTMLGAEAAMEMVTPVLSQFHARVSSEVANTKQRLLRLLELYNLALFRSFVADSEEKSGDDEPRLQNNESKAARRWAAQEFESLMASFVADFNGSVLSLRTLPRGGCCDRPHAQIVVGMTSSRTDSLAQVTVNMTDVSALSAFFCALTNGSQWQVTNIMNGFETDDPTVDPRLRIRIMRWNQYFSLTLGLRDVEILCEDLLEYEDIADALSKGDWHRSLCPDVNRKRIRDTTI